METKGKYKINLDKIKEKKGKENWEKANTTTEKLSLLAKEKGWE